MLVMPRLLELILRRICLRYRSLNSSLPKSIFVQETLIRLRRKTLSTEVPPLNFTSNSRKLRGVSCLAAALFAFFFAYPANGLKNLLSKGAKNDKANKQKFSLRRYKRFLDFTSLQYKNEFYMTANDFIKAVTQDDPPEPERGFHIAFEMFDTDGNETVDKNEFLILEAVLGRGKNSNDDLVRLDADEKLNESNSNESKDDEKGVFDWVWQKSGGIVYNPKVQDTSLLIHLFGPKGSSQLTYADFRKFMDDIQTEILEIEFREFSSGKMEISESDFARMLLRHAPLTNERRMSYMTRIDRKKSDRLITFDQFRMFCRFLNALDDFTIAVKLYTFADLPVSQTEFARAVKITTGFSFDAYFIDVLFKIFDVDDNGRLSYSEFIHIMKQRLHRGFRAIPTSTDIWPCFKRCVREELKRY
uniref:EF-hand domain-containing protein n=1 Tax=Romanomermis culicivorax TaxID=13658 RepID=A0A915K318_ROMCU